MKRNLLSVVFILTCFHLFAQKVSNVDFTAIRKSLDSSAGLYKKLVARLNESDTTLTPDEYRVLYYGQFFQESYSPYGIDANNDAFKKSYEKQDYATALPIAMKMLSNNPVDIKMIFKALVCNHYLNDEVNKRKMNIRYENLLMTIFESGDGNSPETAWVVMRVSDEYELMANMQVENTMQSLVQGPAGPCDKMTLKKNDLNLEVIYFNVTKLFESMSKTMKGK